MYIDEESAGYQSFAQLTEHTILEREELDALILEWKKNADLATQNKIFSSNIRTILEVAHKVTGLHGSALGEYITPGLEGLLKALHSFKPELGYAFSTLATIRVRGAIIDYLRKTGLVRASRNKKSKTVEPNLKHACPREEVPGAMLNQQGMEKEPTGTSKSKGTKKSDYNLKHACPLEEILGVTLSYQGVEDITSRRVEVTDLNQKLLSALDILPEREHRVIKMRYWEDLTLVETGQKLGVSYERIRQIQKDAMQNLRAKLT